MVCIGKEITEELECEPAKFYIKRYIRYKYAAKNGNGVSIAELPERVIDKGNPWLASTGPDINREIYGSSSPVPPETDLRQGEYTDPLLDDRRLDKRSPDPTRAALRSAALRHQSQRVSAGG